MSLTYKTFYDVAKLTVWGDVKDGKTSRLVLSFRDGNPRFTAYTGEQGPGGVISFPMDVFTFGSVIQLMRDITASPNGNSFTFDSLTVVYEDNQPTDKTRVVSKLVVGKSDEGVNYIAVVTDGKAPAMFPIVPTKWHNYSDKEGNPLPKGPVSNSLLKGMCSLMENVLANITVQYSNEEYTESDRKPTLIKTNVTTSTTSVSTEDILAGINF